MKRRNKLLEEGSQGHLESHGLSHWAGERVELTSIPTQTLWCLTLWSLFKGHNGICTFGNLQSPHSGQKSTVMGNAEPGLTRRDAKFPKAEEAGLV
jgi:hypothetical protein